MGESYVVLVDENDNPLGVMEKMKAHREAKLHRAISVFIIDSQGGWVLQKRALDKYHSSGLWTNTCCTHPYPGEDGKDAAKRRLLEEMNLKCDLKEIFSFVYREKLDNDLTEYEYDHVFVGITDEDPIVNKDEVLEWKRISYDEIVKDTLSHPGSYTIWFREIFKKVHEHILP